MEFLPSELGERSVGKIKGYSQETSTGNRILDPRSLFSDEATTMPFKWMLRVRSQIWHIAVCVVYEVITVPHFDSTRH